MDIKEIALKVAEETDAKYPWNMNQDKWIVVFAAALLAEVQKQNEPVGYVAHGSTMPRNSRVFEGCSILSKEDADEYMPECITTLYAFPPSVEAIENKVAEACALQVATETKFHWLDAARVAKEIRSGEWRKHMKGD